MLVLVYLIYSGTCSKLICAAHNYRRLQEFFNFVTIQTGYGRTLSSGRRSIIIRPLRRESELLSKLKAGRVPFSAWVHRNGRWQLLAEIAELRDAAPGVRGKTEPKRRVRPSAQSRAAELASPAPAAPAGGAPSGTTSAEPIWFFARDKRKVRPVLGGRARRPAAAQAARSDDLRLAPGLHELAAHVAGGGVQSRGDAPARDGRRSGRHSGEEEISARPL